MSSLRRCLIYLIPSPSAMSSLARRGSSAVSLSRHSRPVGLQASTCMSRALTTKVPKLRPAQAPGLSPTVYYNPRRNFFNPFVSASPASKDTQTTKSADGRIQHRVTRVVPFPCELMCDLSADVTRYKEFLPFCEDSYVKEATAQFVKDIASHPHPIPNSLHKGKLTGPVQMFEADLSIGFKAFTLTYSSLVSVQHPHRVLSEALPDSAHIFDHLVSEWTFEPVNATSCRVNVLVDFRVANPLYSSVVSAVFADTASRQLEAFTKRAKERYPQWQRERARAMDARERENAVAAQKPMTSAATPAEKVIEPVMASLLRAEGAFWSDAELAALLRLLAPVLAKAYQRDGTVCGFPHSLRTDADADAAAGLTDLSVATAALPGDPIAAYQRALAVLPPTLAGFLSLSPSALLVQRPSAAPVKLTRALFTDFCAALAAHHSLASPVFVLARYSEHYTLSQLQHSPELAQAVWESLVLPAHKANAASVRNTTTGQSAVVGEGEVDFVSLLTALHVLIRSNSLDRMQWLLRRAAGLPVGHSATTLTVQPDVLERALHRYFDVQLSLLEAGVGSVVAHKAQSMGKVQRAVQATALMHAALHEAKSAKAEVITAVLASLASTPHQPLVLTPAQWEMAWSSPLANGLLETATLSGVTGLVDWALDQ